MTTRRQLRIGSPAFATDAKAARLSARIESRDGVRELFYSIPVERADWFARQTCDGFVLGVLLQAMSRNEDVHVDGPMSSRLFHSLRNFFIPMAAGAYPSLHRIDVVPSSLTNVRLNGTGVATGFSAGIDSFAAVIQHFLQESSEDHRITDFLFNNAGSHGPGNPASARKLFNQRFEKILPFANEVGIPAIPVDSNVGEVLPIDFLTMHSAINASFPLVLQNRFSRFYYASAYTYRDCGVQFSDDFARLDPLAVHLFSTESLECVSTGGQLSRVEKTELVASYEPSHRYLNVCVDPAFEGLNCSVCFKCRRTLLTLEILDLADGYDQVFDLSKFRAIRQRALIEAFTYKKSSFEAEIADLLIKRNSGPVAAAFRARRAWDRLVSR